MKVEMKLKRNRKNRGQGMTEYIIIVALIAIAAIAVVTLFGDNIRKLFGASAGALSGNAENVNDGQKATDSVKKKTLTTFGTGTQTY